MKREFYDVIIIGAGVIGCAIARELSRYDVSVLVLEKESDVGEGTSKANSAIVHAGFDAISGSLKAKFNVKGNQTMESLCRQLSIPFRRNGAMVICWNEDDISKLMTLYDRGIKNGVEGLRLLSGDEARKLEPALQDNIHAALLAPTSGIICPFELTLALAENANDNGVEFSLCNAVLSMTRQDVRYGVHTQRGDVWGYSVINCAGVYADRIHDMLLEPCFSIKARKGEYMLLDKNNGQLVERTIFQVPSEMGKGVLVTPTVHGNLLVGPTAVDNSDKENTATTDSGLDEVRRVASLSVEGIPFRQVITSFSGLRACGNTGDFLIQDHDGFIDVACIESPGLSSAPAIACHVAGLVGNTVHLTKKKSFDPNRKGFVRLSSLPMEERNSLIRQRPDYGRIVCRCEQISEGEILDSIRRPLGATTLDGIKRRVRAGMGRCQGGFCSPRVTELLAMELGMAFGEVKKNG